MPTDPDLLPPNRNPAQVPGITIDPATREAIEVFDGPGEKRWYDWVDQLDGLTIGFGQWPQSEFPAFLSDLAHRGTATAFPAFKARLAQFYAGHPEAWNLVPGHEGQPEAARIGTMLASTLFNKAFMARWQHNCAKDKHQYCLPDSPSFFRDACDPPHDWAGSALRHALRDRAVVQWQVDYWQAYLIDKAWKDAAAAGLGGVPGMVAMASMRSSAPGYVKDFLPQLETGVVTREDRSWDWNHPGGGGTDQASWRLLVAWQYYNTVKHRIRGRSQSFYERYLAAHWRLPKLKRDGTPEWSAPENSDPQSVRWLG